MKLPSNKAFLLSTLALALISIAMLVRSLLICEDPLQEEIRDQIAYSLGLSDGYKNGFSEAESLYTQYKGSRFIKNLELDWIGPDTIWTYNPFDLPKIIGPDSTVIIHFQLNFGQSVIFADHTLRLTPREAKKDMTISNADVYYYPADTTKRDEK